MSIPSSTSPTGRASMRSRFHDEGDTSYDSAIESTRTHMEGKSHCECERELQLLVHKLKQIRPTYTPRPCVEGTCLGLVVPHRSRIDTRVAALKSEQDLHNNGCKQEMADRDFERQKELERMKIDAQKDIEKTKIAAQSTSTKTKTSTETGRF